MGWKMRKCGHMGERNEAVEYWLFTCGQSTTFFLTEAVTLLLFIYFLFIILLKNEV